jgi:hypothetical protein
MNERTQNCLFAACGIGSVVVELAGVAIGAAGGRQFATIGTSPAGIAKAVAGHAGTAVWVGAYLELLSFGLFLAFAMWACARLGGGILGDLGRASATAYAAVSIVALGLGDAIAYRSGKGTGLQLASTLFTLNEALFVCTWFLSVFFLLAVAPLAFFAGRRALGFGAVGVALLTLVTTALSVDNAAQLTNMLWLAWIVWASVALARGVRQRSAVAVAIA